MRIIVLIAALTLGAPCRSDTGTPNGTDTIAYGKQIDVATLDPTLRTQPFEEWLRVGPMRAERLDWQTSDCDLKPDYREPPNGYPLCVKVVYQRGEVSGWVIVAVGTARKGITGPPHFASALATTKAGNVVRSENVKELSSLP